MLAINDSSLRPGSARAAAPEDMLELIRAAQKYGTFLVMGSDAHICWDVGRMDRAQEVLERSGFPIDHILNFREDGLDKIMNLTDMPENIKIDGMAFSD